MYANPVSRQLALHTAAQAVMIDEDLQAEIRAAYQELTDSLLVPRWGQRQ